MKIAVIDDKKREREYLKHHILSYFENRKAYPILPELVEYDSGEAFLECFSPGAFALVFLDIYMEALTGIDVAKRISVLDKSCSILFFTTSSENQLDGYEVHAIGYIMKPVSEHLPALYNALDYFTEKYKPDVSSIKVPYAGEELSLYHRDILYYECLERKLYLHMTTGVLLIHGKYSDYQAHFLSDPRFLECYRNLIINMDYIEAPSNNEFIMKNGDILPISRRKRAEVMGIYMKYFVQNGRL